MDRSPIIARQHSVAVILAPVATRFARLAIAASTLLAPALALAQRQPEPTVQTPPASAQVPMGATSDPAEVDRIYREAAMAEENGDQARAAALYTEALGLLPPSSDPKRQRDREHVLSDALNAHLAAAALATQDKQLAQLDEAIVLISSFQDAVLAPETLRLVHSIRERRATLAPSAEEPTEMEPPPCPVCADMSPRLPPAAPKTDRLRKAAFATKIAAAAALVPAAAGSGVAFFLAHDQRNELEEKTTDGVEVDAMTKSNNRIRITAIIGASSSIAAVACLTTSLILEHRAKKRTDDKAAFQVSPAIGAAWLGITGSF